MKLQLDDMARVIQLATAPVFLLAAVGSILVVLTNRLGRIIDRSRVLEERLARAAEDASLSELHSLYRRAHLINIAITATTSSGLLVCVVIAMLFLGNTTSLPLEQVIAACFVFAMAGLLVGLIAFLREIFVCCNFIRRQQLKAFARP